jgi:hypothetical protein
MLIADGFDKALIGVGRQCMTDIAVYDYDKCVDILIERDGMSYDEAVDYMEFNVVGSYVGQQTPIFLQHTDEEL